MQARHPGPPVRLAAAAIGAVRLGIPVDCVVQAIPVPEAPAMLPRRQGALRGVVEHEGALVPVVDLARWVDVGPAPAVSHSGQAGQRILILREAGRTIGLQVGSVDGLVELPEDAVARLHHDDDHEEVFHSAARVPGTGQILSLLDVGRLADLAASWCEAGSPSAVHEPAPGAAPGAAGDAASGGMRQYALLQLGTVRLGVPAADLAEVVAMPALERLGAGAWCRWRGRHLAVLPSPSLLASAEDCAAPLLAVVEHAGLVLGLPVGAALGLESCPAGGHRDPGAFTSSVFGADGGEIRLLDTAGLFERFPEALLSKVDAAPAQAGAARADAGVPNEDAYIVFEADGFVATPIDALDQILPLQAAPGATMEWEGRAIPLVDLRRRAGGGHVLVTAGPAPRVGYVVTRVELLVPAGSGKLYRMGAGSGKETAFVMTDTGSGGSGSGKASYRIVDLEAAGRAA